jgi:hypothetical protein
MSSDRRQWIEQARKEQEVVRQLEQALDPRDLAARVQLERMGKLSGCNN